MDFEVDTYLSYQPTIWGVKSLNSVCTNLLRSVASDESVAEENHNLRDRIVACH